MPKKLTQEEFNSRMKGKNITVLSPYVNSSTHVKCVCDVCAYEWSTNPNKLMSGGSNGTGTGCRKCSGYLKLTHDEFLEKMVGRNITILSKYKAVNKHVKCSCDICSYEWSTTPNSLTSTKNPTGCPNCYGNIKSTHEEFLEKVKGRNIEILTPYTNSKTKVKVRCEIDGHEWWAIPNNLIPPRKNSKRRATGCPRCGLSNKSETKIASYLSEALNIEVVQGTHPIEYTEGDGRNYPLQIDILIPELNIAVEYDGYQHYTYPNFYHKTKDAYDALLKRDKFKNSWCESNGIKLIRIKESEFNVGLKLEDQQEFLDNLVENIKSCVL